MTENDLNHYDKVFESNKSSFVKEVLSPACKGVDSYIISKNYNSGIEDLQIKTNELKARSIDFTKSFSPILQMKNVSLINHRLQIAIIIRNISSLYNSFDNLYKKETSDRSILDIMKLIKIHTKLNSILPQYCQIQACYKIKENIDQKILNIREKIIETINNRGYYNLTSFELFQLIIISSTFDHFWNLFGLNDSLFTTEDYTIFMINIQNILLFFGKFGKLSNLLTQLNLKKYLDGIQIQKDNFINIIFEKIRKLRKITNPITNFESFSDGIFNKLDLLKAIELNENISSQFRSRLNEELSEIAVFIYQNLSKMDINQFPYLKSNSKNLFLDYIIKLNSSLKLHVNPSQYHRLENSNYVRGITHLYRKFITMRSEQGFIAFPGLLDEVIYLTTASRKSNEEFIDAFRTAFYDVALREFNSVIASLLKILNMKVLKNFQNSDHFKGNFDIIYKRGDKSICKKEIMDNIILKLEDAIKIKNNVSEFYEKQKVYVDAIVKHEHPESESPKSEPPKFELHKFEPPESESPKSEPPKSESPKSESPKSEPPKFEPPKSESPKSEPPKSESPKSESPKSESPKSESPKSESPKSEPPKSESPKSEPPKSESPKSEPPKFEPPKSESPKFEPPKPESPRSFNLFKKAKDLFKKT